MMRPVRSAVLTLILALGLAGCRAATPPPTAVPMSTPALERETPELPNDVHWARNSAEHRANLIQTYRFAGETLAAIVADLEPGTWAVALDADETIIDNSLYQKERAALGEGYSSESWGVWVARREAPPLPGAVEFLEAVGRFGGKVTVVTNRKQAHCPDTEANFLKFSIPYDVILCKPEGGDRKEPRWQRVEEGTASQSLPPLDIVMWIGDNIRDFPHLDQDMKDQPEAVFERFGLDFFVLPNPMYGSWEDNPAN